MKEKVCILTTLILIAIMTILSASVLADVKVSDASYPHEANVGEEVTIQITVKNEGNKSATSILVLLYIYKEEMKKRPDMVEIISVIPADRTQTVSFNWKPDKSGIYSLYIKIYKDKNGNGFWDATDEHMSDKKYSDAISVKESTKSLTTDFFGIPYLFLGLILVIIVSVAIIGVVVSKRKKKKRDERLSTTYRIDSTSRIRGKFPPDYFKHRREKLAVLKPIGLTSSGVTILGIIKKGENEEEVEKEDTKKTCPKCGILYDPGWKTCMFCASSEKIEEAKNILDKLRETDADISRYVEFMRQAESSLDSLNYTEAETYAMEIITRGKEELERMGIGVEREVEKIELVKVPSEEHVISETSKEISEPIKEEKQSEDIPIESHPSIVEKEYEEDMIELPSISTVDKEKVYDEGSVRAQEYGGETISESYSEKKALESVAPSEEVKEEVKKEVKKKLPENACVSCERILKKDWKKCPFCGAMQEVKCPGCGTMVKIRWDVCPYCGLSLKEKGAKCPKCGERIKGVECLRCKAEDLKKKAEYVIEECKKENIEVRDAEKELGKGEISFKLKRYEKAIDMYISAKEKAESIRKNKVLKDVDNVMNEFEELVRDIKDIGELPSSIGTLYENAKSAYKQEAYSLAMRYAKEGVMQAEQYLPKLMEEKKRKEEEEKRRKAARPRIVSVPSVKEKKPRIVIHKADEKRCSACRRILKPSWGVCPYCGAEVVEKRKCPSCGNVLDSKWTVCPFCGINV